MQLKKGKKVKISLIVEKADGELWGRCKVKGNLIVDSAPDMDALRKQIRQLILDFENVEVEGFDISYDLTAFFESHSYINISEVGKKAGINPSLMRQYAIGQKFPSEERVKEIETGIHEIGRELTKARLHRPKKEYTAQL